MVSGWITAGEIAGALVVPWTVDCGPVAVTVRRGLFDGIVDGRVPRG
jgi:hypothetical protein